MHQTPDGFVPLVVNISFITEKLILLRWSPLVASPC